MEDHQEGKVTIDLSHDLQDKIDYIIKMMDFNGREEFVNVAVQRSVEYYIRMLNRAIGTK